MVKHNSSAREKFTFPMVAGAGSNIFEYWVINHANVFLPSLCLVSAWGCVSLMIPASPNRHALVLVATDDSGPWALVGLPLLFVPPA